MLNQNTHIYIYIYSEP